MANQSLPSQPQSSSPKTSETATSPTKGQKVSRFLGWPFWALIIMMGFGVTGFFATSVLVSFNTPKGCESVFWPLASGSRRLYCAQVKAEKGNADSLLAAIKLVSVLPEDHPLRTEINKNIKIWSEQVLALGEKRFQAGKLEEAMEIANKIPASIASNEVIEQKKQRWRNIWEKGEAIEQDVEENLKEGAWNLAFKKAGELVDLDNEYLANQHYTEIINNIKQEKQYAKTLEEAKTAFEQGGINDLLTAFKKAQKIDSDSYSYQKAQDLINKVGETMIAKAQQNLEQRNWNQVLKIVKAIPESLGLEEKIADFRHIALAGSQAQIGTVAGLNDAIARAKQIEEQRPLYDKAQSLINRWEKEIKGVKIVTQAKQQAQGGDISDFKAAIAKAGEVPQDNPRYQQAQQLINQWDRRIEIIEDRPILNRATQIARGGDISAYQSAISVASQISRGRALYQEAQGKIASWRNQIQRIEDRPILSKATRLANQGQLEAAIDTAQQISRGRALYREAQGKISRWQDQIERIEDRPILSRATQLANQGQLEAAIDTAQQISRGRALYQEAQSKIRRWRSELRARQQAKQAIQEASELAQAQTVESLIQALETIQQAQNSANYRNKAQRLMNQWSQQIYAIARERAQQKNLPAAIGIAQRIPSQSNVYQDVRQQIQQWQQQLTQQQEQEQQEE